MPTSPPTRRAASSASLIPFGQEATPSFQAASIMFWAQRPTSKPRAPTIATTSAAVRTFCGANTAAASAARSETTTNRHSCRFIALPARRPASRIRVTTSSGSGGRA